jgi:transposase
VVLVLDNGPIHVRKASRAALAERARRLAVGWLCKYAPELNDIEIVWGHLKAPHLADRAFADFDNLENAVHHADADLNSGRNRDPLDRQRIFAMKIPRVNAIAHFA